MKLLHTSDWHLGRSLHGRHRDDEFAQFLDWLLDALTEHSVEALLVAGDIFDTTTPSHRAQSLYYRFLGRVAHESPCRHVVVIGGNHDSPSLLDAPADLLRALQVHVVGAARDNPADEVITLRDAQGQAQLLVCAVPYLRDRDIRRSQPGESPLDKEQQLLAGLRTHYHAVIDAAMQQRDALAADSGRRLPVVGMGHLFTAGGETVEGDGVRDLYVGSLAHVEAAIFPDTLSYVALGHLHRAQKVAGRDTVRYSGSPLPMGFGEAGQTKQVCLVNLATDAPAQVESLDVPEFRALRRLRGDLSALEAGLDALRAAGTRAWLDVNYDGPEIIPDLREQLETRLGDAPVEILRVGNAVAVQQAMLAREPDEALSALTAEQVFERCLRQHDVPPEQQQELWPAFHEILQSVLDDDPQAGQA